MLLNIGIVRCELVPFNLREFGREMSGDYARKDVIGAPRPLEAVGRGDDILTLDAVVFPEQFGGLSAIELLYAMCETQFPQLVIRGDGRQLGWRVVTRNSDWSSYLNSQGIGRKIEVDVTLEKVPAPSPAQAFSQLYSLLS